MLERLADGHGGPAVWNRCAQDGCLESGLDWHQHQDHRRQHHLHRGGGGGARPMPQQDSPLIDAAARVAVASPLMDAAERAGLFSYVSVPQVDPPAPPSPPPQRLQPPPCPPTSPRPPPPQITITRAALARSEHTGDLVLVAQAGGRVADAPPSPTEDGPAEDGGREESSEEGREESSEESSGEFARLRDLQASQFAGLRDLLATASSMTADVQPSPAAVQPPPATVLRRSPSSLPSPDSQASAPAPTLTSPTPTPPTAQPQLPSLSPRASPAAAAALTLYTHPTLPTAQLRHRGNGSAWALAAADDEPGVVAVPLLHGELTLAALHEPVSWDAHAAGIDPWEVKEMSQPSQQQPPTDAVGPAALGFVPQIAHRTALLDAKPAEQTNRPLVYNPSAAQLLVLRGLSLGMLLALTALVSTGAGSVVKAFRD
jgi:hypothetical protein